MSTNADVQPPTIEAAAYQPYEPEQQKRGPSALTLVLAAVMLVALAVLFYLFTARSVAFKFSSPPSTVEISGGFAFELGGVYLLRTGQYTVQAQAEGYEPLSAEIEVGEERNQEVILNFTPLPGVISFDLTPPDAHVEFDGVAIGTAQAARIAAGEHEVHVHHPRYQPETVLFTVDGREQAQTFSAVLKPNWADVSVSSSPDGANILIDGEPTGAATPATVEVLAGEREISVEKEGFRAGRVRLVVAAEQPETIPQFALVQADARVRITSRPAGAGITLNGEFVGQTPLQLTLKSSERYRVEAILDGYRRAQTRFQPARGDNAPISLNLIQELGEVIVEARPAGARLRINGRSGGTANQTLNLPLKAHEIAVELDGYAAYKTTVTPRAGISQSVRVQLLTVEEARRRALKPRYSTGEGQELVLIEPGTLTVGASRREPGRRANETLREVTLTRLYYISRHEVTNAQFRKFIAGHDSGEFESNTLNKDDQPVVDVGWHDAAMYCNWLSDQEGLPPYYNIELGRVKSSNPTATGYRLPTEAEWAWVARTQPGNSTTYRYAWGDNLPPPDRHGNYADRAAQHLVGRIIYGYNDNYVATAPVGSYQPNAYDLYDIGGNVAEWINDFYEIPGKDAVTDPLGPPSGEYHVIKGPSWMHGTVTDLRLSFRDYGIDGRQDLGFRIARNAE